MRKINNPKFLVCGIYKITSPSGKIYIGSSNNILKRITYYKGLHCKGQVRLYASLVKYGWENHIFEIIEKCSIEKLPSLERAWGDFYEVLNEEGLNCELPGYGEKRQVRSKETQEKITSKLRGQKRTQEQKDRIRNGRIYTKMSDEEKEEKRIFNNIRRRKNISLEIKSIQKVVKEIKEKILSEKINGTYFQSNKKIIIDMNNGVFYESIAEAAFYTQNKYKPNTLSMMLSGSRTNKTNLIYA